MESATKLQIRERDTKELQCGEYHKVANWGERYQRVARGRRETNEGNKHANCEEVAQTYDLLPNQALIPC